MCCIAIDCVATQAQESEKSEADGVIGGHEYVNLGLPSGTLWATYNVGATSPYEKGDYFAWGEVEPRDDFSWESYKFFEGYRIDPETGSWAVLEDIGTDISGTEYDAARYQWGYGWRLPNEKERYELRMLCWNNGPSEENGVYGVRIHGPNGHSIFLPVCGYGLWYGTPDPFDRISASYWSGVEDTEFVYNSRPDEPNTRSLSFSVDRYGGYTGASSLKAYGLNIRAVVNLKESGIDNVISDYGKVSLTYRNECVYISGNRSEGLITVFDMSGRMTYSDSVMNGICKLSQLANGIYIVSYSVNGVAIANQKITIR